MGIFQRSACQRAAVARRAALALGLFWAAASPLTSMAQSYGLATAQPIGAFLSGSLPATTPGQGAAPEAPALLSSIGAFTSLANLTPAAGILPYDLNSPLWTDAASKRRWLAVPNDGSHNTPAEKITFSQTGEWAFPVGSVLIKQFDLGIDDANPAAMRKLETRFLVHGSDGAYYGITYRWRADGSDADLLTDGQEESIAIATVGGGTRSQTWSYPSRADCMNCHNANANSVLGPRTHQFNRDFLYAATGVTDNQLRALGNIGLLSAPFSEAAISGYLKSVNIADMSATLEDRARSYLSSNCSHCHRPGGTNAYFDARFDTTLTQQNIVNGPLLYSNGVAGAHVVTPVSVPQSMAHIRMASLGPEQMPPVGKNVVDSQALAVLEAWIASLPPSGSGSNAAPVAADDSGAAAYETPIILSVLDNDSDADADPLSIESVGQGANGTVAINADNSITYTPDPGFAGFDYFGYQARDPSGAISNTATVSVSVAAAGADGAIGFTDNSSKLDTPSRSGVAMAIADMNNDGLDDIVRLHVAKYLGIDFQDPAGGNFTTYEHGPAVSTRSQWGICVGDANQDGINDIVSGGYYDGLKLFTGNASATAWTKTTLGGPTLFLQTVNFADIDMDGDVDVFACHDDAESKKYRNDGGTLTLDASLIDTTTTPASDNSGNYGTVWTDYDGDGDLDMYLSKCRGGVSSPSDPRRINMLFQNDGSGNYTEVAAAAGLKFGEQSWATDFADIDNDGDLDCFVGNHFANSFLMRNNGNGTFTDISTQSGIAPFSWKVIQVVFRDFNNDGWVDLLLTGAQHILYINDGAPAGGLTFSAVANPFGGNWIESCAAGDLNHDGFVDLFVGYATLYNTPSTTKTDRIFLNDGNDNHYLGLRLEGVASNRNGIGARAELHGPWGIQVREVRAGEGYGIQHSMHCHFGLGQYSQATSLVVRWPSGTVDTIDNPTADQYLFLREGASAPPVISPPSDQEHWADETLSLQLTASDPTNDPLTYSAANLPPGLSIDAQSGLISGTLGFASPGLYTVLVSASDAFGSSSVTFTWKVKSVLGRYDGWAANTPGAGSSPYDNTDGDVLSDLLEFALGAKPDDGSTAGIGLRIDPSGGDIDVLYLRPADLEATSYTLEASADLGSWTDLGPPSISANSDGTETVRYQALGTTAPLTEASGFVRLRVELASPAATAYTIPIGWNSVEVGGGFRTHGVSLAPPAVFIGRIASLSGNTLGFIHGSPAANMLAGKSYYLEIASGPREGQRAEIDPVTTAGANVGLDLAAAGSTLTTVTGDLLDIPIIIRPHNTLGGVYPIEQFTGSSDPAQADQIQVFENGGYESYFLLLAGGYHQWTHVTDTGIGDAGETILAPGRGTFIRRNGNPIDLLCTGEVRFYAFAQPLNEGFNLLAQAHPIADSPAARGMQLSNGFSGSLSPSLADRIQVYLPDTDPAATGYRTYFLLDGGAGSGLEHWVESTDGTLANQDNSALFLPGRASFVRIYTTGGHPGWVIPAPWTP